MDLRATKTHAEREDEEVERLARPAPKQKPPRHDKRRETVDTDPEVESDADLSLNFKDIGGSVFQRWLVRQARAKQDKIPAKSKETGKTVFISPETLKTEPGKYEPLKGDEAEKAKEQDATRQWVKKNRHKRKDFQDFLKDMPTAGSLAETGEALVLNPKTKKRVPFERLPPEVQKKLIDEFSSARKEKGLSEKEIKRKEALKAEVKQLPGDVRQHLEDLTDPDSAESQRIANLVKDHDPKDILVERVLPDLKGKLPPRVKTLADVHELVKAAGDTAKEREEEASKSEAEKAGIPPPRRREATAVEKMEAVQMLMDSFPPAQAAALIGQNLHPDDVREMVGAYNATKTVPVKDPEAFAKDAAEFFELDPDRVKPPTSWKNKEGKRVPFDSLTPAEKSEAMRQHQMRVVAASMAAQDQLTESLSRPSLLGKPRVPPTLARTLSTFMLSKGTEEDAANAAGQVFYQAVADNAAVELRQLGTSDREIKKLLGSLSPASRKIATSYFQAADYQEAKRKFLGAGKAEGDTITEHSKPKDIFKALQKASDFFNKRARAYGAEEGPNPARNAFQIRTLDRLRSLKPDSYKEVRGMLDRVDADAYKKAHAKWAEEQKAWEARKKAWGARNSPYRGKPFEEAPPEEPKKPPRYALAEPKEAQSAGADLLEDLKASRAKVASRVVQRFISTCSGDLAMGQHANKQSVYHGVEPQKHYPPAYPGWQQAHQRDLGEADYDTILKAAKGWLKAPVLSKGIEGITKDQQLRAALDLALQRSIYVRQIDCNTYDMLLARLAGEPEPGPGQTLLTLTARADSPYPPTLKNEVISMKASHEVRTMAASVAGTNPNLAFELIDLADRLAAQEQEKKEGQQEKKEGQQEQEKEGQEEGQQKKEASDKYASLKSLVIRTAASDADAKKVLTPVLQKIKELG